MCHWYTLENPNTYAKASKVLNDVVSRKEAENVQPYLAWLRKICQALAKMPASLYLECTFFRGVRYRYKDGKEWNKFAPKKVGKTRICWYVIKSVSCSREIAECFAGEKGTVFIVHGCKALSVSAFSAFNEDEALISPGQRFVVESRERRSCLCVLVTLRAD